MVFFFKLFHFKENSYTQTQSLLQKIAKITPDTSRGYLQEHCEFALSNGRTVPAGTFSMPSVATLRDYVQTSTQLSDFDFSNEDNNNNIVRVQNIIGESRSMHSKKEFQGAIIQAASQFNGLEFPSPNGIPEDGIEKYAYDCTQGPACAVACAAGTAYRNYLVPFVDSTFTRTTTTATTIRGQTRNNQLNGLKMIESYIIENTHLDEVPWRVQNGYIDAFEQDLTKLNDLLIQTPQLRNELISRLCIFVQEDTCVTDLFVKEQKQKNKEKDDFFCVTQTYNSAISIGYSRVPSHIWEPMARIVLDATYEATILVGLIKTIENLKANKSTKPILLTKVGGGVFKNKDSWIQDAIVRAIKNNTIFGIPMDIQIVHFQEVDNDYRKLETIPMLL